MQYVTVLMKRRDLKCPPQSLHTTILSTGPRAPSPFSSSMRWWRMDKAYMDPFSKHRPTYAR
eukprot:8447004-Prorocentrum_lima.AAC.1